MADAPAQSFITPFEDSRRWRSIARRPGDIIISTPPKSGTTWMLGIVNSLLWPEGDSPAPFGELGPWVDMRMTPIDELASRLAAQDHRRYLKTHSPGDCVPFDNFCRYIVVYRDGRDSLVSWGNHRSTMRPEVVEAANAVAAEAGVDPIDVRWDGNYDTLFDEWLQVCSPFRHLVPWWKRRHEPNVLFVHYADLLSDLEGEMRRIAGFLTIEFEEGLWPDVVARCRIERMRADAHAHGGLNRSYDGGADAFFYKGTNGRWPDLLRPAQIDRYLTLVAELLPEDAASWLEHGSRALGTRPNEIGEAEETRLDTGVWHPVFSRLAKQPANSIDAIAERRVEEAREAGLFDDLALHGKPIPDLDRHRQPGWWANQFVSKEHNKVMALQLEEELRSAMPALWRLDTETEVAARVDRLNERIDAYNRLTTLQPMDRLIVTDTVATWRGLRNRAE